MSDFHLSSDGSDFLGFEPERLGEDSSDMSDGSDLAESEESSCDSDGGDQGASVSSYDYGENRFKWAKALPERRGRPLAQNIVREAAGLKGAAKNLTDKSPLSLWSLFMNDVMLEDIVVNTNVQISLKRMEYKDISNP
ncbi:hypothetical protein QAD02_020592 [Eretmocerus hayati]|uniref:Uncharacterized protein n=1 Tax=Eretmocerus hayati TaxID=131215 RepID=A0ACC2PQC7_9HYME|nr:hypothetical protein QAD02_020592 [Eretmocerus hayati]